MNNKSPKAIGAVVPAAGIGKRMGAEIPKQYLTIHQKTIIEWTLDKLLRVPLITHIVVVLHPDDIHFKQLPFASHPKILTCVGGDERADSVLAGLKHLPDESEWALVHDAARPLVDPNDIQSLIQSCLQHNMGGILATRVRDTMKRSHQHQSLIAETVPRESLWHALTPQMFQRSTLIAAYEQAITMDAIMTDEASVIERLEQPVQLIEGRADNIKVTQPEDIFFTEFKLAQSLQEVK